MRDYDYDKSGRTVYAPEKMKSILYWTERHGNPFASKQYLS